MDWQARINFLLDQYKNGGLGQKETSDKVIEAFLLSLSSPGPEGPHLAKGDELLGIMLEEFIAGFTPTGWRETIRMAMGRPMIVASEAKVLREAFEIGNLLGYLNSDPRGPRAHWYCNPNVQEAVVAFFRENLTVS